MIVKFKSAAVAMAIAGVATIMSGCAGPHGPGADTGIHAMGVRPPSPVKCNPGICELKVFVNDCDAEHGISVLPPNLEVDGPRGTSRNMRWEIMTPGYEFTNYGISGLPTVEFTVPVGHKQPNEFKLQNKHNQAGTFKYAVNVKPINSTSVCRPLDPWIRNSF